MRCAGYGTGVIRVASATSSRRCWEVTISIAGQALTAKPQVPDDAHELVDRVTD